MANIKSIDEAVEIIQNGSRESKVKDALAYLMAHDPSNPLVAQYNQDPEAFMADNAQRMVVEYEQSLDELRVQVDEEDPENVKNNEESIEKAVEKAVADSDEFDTERRALNNTTITGDDGQVLSEKEQNDAREAFYRAILENTKLMLAGDSRYTRASEKDRETRATQIFRDSFRASFAAMLGAKAGLPQEGESNGEYVDRVVETVARANEPYEVRRAYVAIQTSRVQNEITARAKYYYYKSRMAVGSAKSNLKKLSGYFKEKSTKFGALMNKLTHGAHEMGLKAWNAVKVNRWQVAARVGLFGAYSLATVMTGGAVAAIPAVYMSALAATHAIFPLWSKRNQIIDNIQKNVQGFEDENIEDWKGWKGIKRAHKAMSGREKVKHWSKAVGLGTIGLAGGAAIGLTGDVAIRKMASLGMLTFGFAHQSAFLGVAQMDVNKLKKSLKIINSQLRENPNDEKLKEKKDALLVQLAQVKSNRNNEAFGTVLSAAIGAATLAGLGSSARAAEETSVNANGVPADSLASDTTHTSGTDVADVADAAPVAPEVSEAQAYWENYEVPQTAEEAGISQRRWNFIHRVVSGEFSTTEGAEHLGGTQVDSQNFIDVSVRNIATYQHLHPEFCPDKTPMQIFENLCTHTAWSLIPEQAHADGHLFTIGEFKFATHNEELKGLWAIVCDGWEANINTSPEEMTDALKVVQSDGGLEGVVGTRNVRMVGLACQEAAFRRGPRVHIHVPHDHPVRVSTPTPLEKTETVVDVPQERVPLEKTETVVDAPQENIVSAQVNDATGISGQGSGQLPENTGNIYTQGNVAVELDEKGNPAAFVGKLKQGHGR